MLMGLIKLRINPRKNAGLGASERIRYILRMEYLVAEMGPADLKNYSAVFLQEYLTG